MPKVVPRINDADREKIAHNRYKERSAYCAYIRRLEDELPITSRTAYKYIDMGILDVRNIDLRRQAG